MSERNDILNEQLETKYPYIEDIQSKYGDALINTPAGQRGNFFSVDPFGVFGTREAEIKRIAEQDYNPAQGFQLGHNARMLGITEQDVANYVLPQYESMRKRTDAARFGRTEFAEGQRPNAATSQTDLQAKVKSIQKGRTIESGIRATDGGAALIKGLTEKLGRKPTNTELESLATQATYGTREMEAGRQLASAELDRTKQLTQASKDNVDINKDRLGIEEGQLNLNSRIAHNNNVVNLRNADIATINANNQRIQLENSERNSQADRDLRRDLAILTREDNREDRRFDRERDERRDRNNMIMQLLGGLKNLAI